MLHRVRSITNKELLHIVRDGRTFFMVFIAPAFTLVMLSYLFSWDVEHFTLGVLDQDRSSLSRQYIAALTEDGTITLREDISNRERVDDLLSAGLVQGVVVLPPGLMEQVGSGQPGKTLDRLLEFVGAAAGEVDAAGILGEDYVTANQESLLPTEKTEAVLGMAGRMDNIELQVAGVQDVIIQWAGVVKLRAFHAEEGICLGNRRRPESLLQGMKKNLGSGELFKIIVAPPVVTVKMGIDNDVNV